MYPLKKNILDAVKVIYAHLRRCYSQGDSDTV